MRILIVEHENQVFAEIERILSGHENNSLMIETNGREALRKIGGQPPDLVIMEFNLPGELDGIQTSELIRKQIEVPIIFLVSDSYQITSQRSRSTQPLAYLVKPIKDYELEYAIEIAVEQHSVERKLRETEAQLRILYQTDMESRTLSETLVETSQILASSLDVNVVLDRILEQVSRVVRNDVCNIMLIEGESTQTVRSRGYEAFNAEAFIESFVFPLSGLPVRQHIIETHQPVVVSDVRTDPQWALTSRAAWLRSYVAAPISLGDKVIGFINVGNSRAGYYQPFHAVSLQAFGHQAALAFQNARLYEETRVNAAYLQILSRRLLNVQESERRVIARELHDEVGQALTAAKLNLQSIQKQPEALSLQARLKECAEIINLALQQVRSLSLDLHPAVLDDLGMIPAVRWFVDREAQRGEFNAQVRAKDLPERFPPEIELVGFRVVQEALTNISRHAHAKNVTVEFWQNDSDLHLFIRDDGIGFDKEATLQKVMKSDSLGLLSMQERIMLIDGHFEINSTPGMGTEIHACIPLNTHESSTNHIGR
jgi:signal transduction histidine kinase